MDSFIHVLGCGDAFSSGGRANTSFLVQHNGKTILLDCGATTLMQMKSYGYDSGDINCIALSHFHGDHFGGLPAIILDQEFGSKKKGSFFITSPTGGKERVFQLLETVYPGNGDILQKQDIQFFYYEENEELSFDDFRIKAFPVLHAPLSLPHGIRLEFDDVTIAFSGDSKWTDSLIDLSNQADIFILDCNFMEKTEAAHLDYKTLSDNLHRLNVGKIYLTHMGEQVIASKEIILEKLADGVKIPLLK